MYKFITIKEMKDKKHSLQDLLKLVENYFKFSSSLKNELKLILEEKTISVSDEQKELSQTEEIPVFQRYSCNVQETYEEFYKDLQEENFSKKQTDLHNTYLSLSKKIYKMEMTEYLFKIHNRELIERLSMMNNI